MNILILGSGGREHALAWKLSQSKKAGTIFIAPGNAGTAAAGINLPVDAGDFAEIGKAVLRNNIGMVVVGPEAPLVSGIHDYFISDNTLRKIPMIGPVSSAARLEGSKDFAKAFMSRHNIPTARYQTFDSATLKDAVASLRTFEPPYVIKADGLAAGKGVIITEALAEAEGELKSIFGGKFGPAGSKVVIEQYLKGVELSVFVVTDGKSFKLLPEAKDYKRAGAGNTGLNTGGMGSISPVPFADNVFMEKVTKRIIEPTMDGLREEGITYKGFVFFGLINVDGNPYMIEYNVRLGDPETEAIIPRISSDLFELMEGVANGDLAERTIDIDDRFVASVMLVSGGYPGHYGKGYEIDGIDAVEDCVLFHSGTQMAGGKTVTSGGRVIAVSSWGSTMDEAIGLAYKNAGKISFRDIYYRKDIGFDL
ncbi:MAG: phosphoribosylamine--glycine ligase [Bacteroidales bacterium]